MTKNDATKIILVGANGRMGRAIRNLIDNEPGYALSGAVENPDYLGDLRNLDCIVADNLEEVLKLAEGVIIDFTQANVAMHSASVAASFGRPIVIGTTGLNPAQKAHLADLGKKCPLLWSGNMSIGVNVLLRILPQLAKTLGPDYDMEIVEIHHNRKKDAPSGTALMLGEALAEARDWDFEACKKTCREGMTGERPKMEIGIQAVRGGDVAGVHTVYFFGPGERIEVTHQAHGRENFAMGALTAAKWLKNQKAGKLYSMQDMFACNS